MGYRSDVVAAFYCTEEEDFPKLQAWVNENLKPVLEANNFDPLTDLEEGKIKGFVLKDMWTKWYDSYDEVIAFEGCAEKFKDECCQEGSSMAYEFIRVGEEDEDIETYSTGDSVGLLWVERKINVGV